MHYGANSCDWIGSYPLGSQTSSRASLSSGDIRLASIRNAGAVVAMFDGCWRHNVNRWNMVKSPHDGMTRTNVLVLGGGTVTMLGKDLPPEGGTFGTASSNFNGLTRDVLWRMDQ